MRTGLIYVRQSKTEPGPASLDDQEAVCGRIPEVAACDRVEVYGDEDISGGTEQREHYHRFMRRIQEAMPGSDVAVVAAYDVSRISREAEVLLRFHRLLARKRWIAVKCPRAGSPGRGHPDGELDPRAEAELVEHVGDVGRDRSLRYE